jgi:hypothetical protein
MGTLDNGGCLFNGEIETLLPFRESLCRECEVKGLGWIYESANVLSAYLQKLVATISNNEREAGGIPTDFTKFTDTQLKKVKVALSKSQGVFLLKQVLIKNRKDTFGSNYMDQANCGYEDEESLAIDHGAYDEGYLIKTIRMLVTILHDTVFPRGSKFTKATTKLQSLLDDPLVKKVLQGKPLTTKDSGRTKSDSFLPSLS